MSNESNFDPPREAEQAPAAGRATEARARPPLTLSIDTASGVRSLGVFRGAEQISLHVCEQTSANSSTVLGDVDRVLRAASVGVREIELFALAVGPGSFTGLRAGLATVKALATTLGKAAAGVPTLHAVAHAAGASEGSVVALIPAGRGEVFAQLLGLNRDGTVYEQTPPTHLPPAELIESVRAVEGRLTWAGAGVEKYRALIEEAARAEGVGVGRGDVGGRVWALAPGDAALARSVAALAAAAYRPSENFAAENLRALYVRPADAKIGGA